VRRRTLPRSGHFARVRQEANVRRVRLPPDGKSLTFIALKRQSSLWRTGDD